MLNYYLNKNNIINRYRVIEKVKENYEKRLLIRLEELEKSRKIMREKNSNKKRSKTLEKQYKSH